MAKTAFFLCAAPLALLFASSADASVTLFTDQASFLAAISAPGIDNFGDFPLHEGLGPLLTRTAGGYGYTATAGGLLLYGEGAGTDRWLSTNDVLAPIILNKFTGGVFGVGGFFFGSDRDGVFSAGAALNFTVTDAGGAYAYTLSNATPNDFFGFVSTTGITSVNFSIADGGRWPALSTLTLGAAAMAPGVPEPATWGLMIIGFGAVGGMTRRRKSRVTTQISYAV